MVTSPAAPTAGRRVPNRVFRKLRGHLSPGEFAAAVRRAAREIGENVACDARYIGRVEAGEIRCPNYAYERVFTHMFPGRTLTDLGFEPRQAVRGRAGRARRASRAPGERREPGPARRPRAAVGEPGAGSPTAIPAAPTGPSTPTPRPVSRSRATSTPRTTTVSPKSPAVPPTAGPTAPVGTPTGSPTDTEEGEVLRRAFITGGTAALATLTSLGQPAAAASPGQPARPRPGAAEAATVSQAVRDLRLLDDRHGADPLYVPAGDALRAAYALLDVGARRQPVHERLHAATGELAISVGWLAHDSGRLTDARAHYAEALATARVCNNPGLEAHAFCNLAFLARDAGRPREAVQAAQAGQRVARHLGSPRLLALLALREADGWAGMGDRAGCARALGRGRELYGRGPSDADPEWLAFFTEAEMASLTARCWATLGHHGSAADHARRAVDLQRPHFTRNIALYSAELADYLTRAGRPEEAAAAGQRSLGLLSQVRSSRVRHLLTDTAGRLAPYRSEATVAAFRDAARRA